MSPFAPEPWSEEALTALAALERPSRPLPLAGSRPAGPGRYVIERSVEDTRAAYESGEAELPPGSSTRRSGPMLVVDAPFGNTGIIFSAASAGCLYSMVHGPNLEVEGFAPTGPVRTFAPVALESRDVLTGKPANFAASEFWVGEQPWLVLAGRLEEGRRRRRHDRGAIIQTSFLAAQQQGDDFKPPTSPATFAFEADGAATITIGAEAGEISVHARRTHGLCSLMVDLGINPLSG